MYSSIQNNIIQLMEQVFYPSKRKDEKATMTAIDELVKYILNLTPEQADKVVSQLPRLSLLLEEPSRPCQPGQIVQTPRA